MSANVNDDLIEATIRRVTQAKAAAARAGDDEAARRAADPEASDSQRAVDYLQPAESAEESAIEATIRRVAEAKAKAESEETGALPEDDRNIGTSSANIDESAIEATIRRVAEAKAQAEAADSFDDAVDEPIAMPANIDESAIEATIRRVAEAKAQAEVADDGVDDAGGEPIATPANIGESAIEATIRRVAEAKAQAEAADDSVDDTGGEPIAVPANIDETAIEATIRRVAEAKAQGEVADDSVDDAGGEPIATPANIGESAIDATIRRVAEAKRRDAAPPPADSSSLRRFMRASPDATPSDEPWRATTDRLQRDIASINAALVTLAERLEALTEEMAGASAAASASSQNSLSRERASVTDDDDEWADSPKILSLPTSLPPRPAIFRDPSPASATAERLVEEPAHQPAPLPPSQLAEAEQHLSALPPPPTADAKRGFDLLPRTYRITIEDKRRSVDLVPLHRSLLAMDGVRDMSLLSYNNGVAIVALETVSEIDPEVLEGIVGRAMSRGARVEQHNEFTLVVKLAEE